MSCRARLVVCCLLAACARPLPGEPPPENSFYFPDGVAVTSNGQYAYVVSSNFDQRFNAGWVSIVDLGAAMSGASRQASIVDQVRIPSLGGSIAIDPQDRFAVVAHRGGESLTVLEIGDGGRSLSCGDDEAEKDLDSEEQHTDCDRRHLVRIVRDHDNWNGELEEDEVRDPYAVSLFNHFDANPNINAEVLLLAVGFISSGRMLVYTVDLDGSGPLLAPRRSVVLGTSGAGNIAPRPAAPGDPTAPTDYVAATSLEFGENSILSTVYNFDVGRTLADDLDGGANFVTQVRLSGSAGGRELIDLVFSPDGSRAYASNNLPDALVVFDTTLGGFQEVAPGGGYTTQVRPRFAILGATPVEGQPAGLAYLARTDGDVLAVLSFSSDTLYLYSVVGDELVPAFRGDGDNAPGLGPFQIAAVPVASGSQRHLLVTTFYDHGLAIVDVPPGQLDGTRRIARLRDGELGDARDQR